MKNYIFGYGSLIESQSRIRTNPSSIKAFPVLINELKRGWWARVPVSGISTTFLGCTTSKTDSVNGVVFEVLEDDIKEFDKRENGYNRVLLKNSQIIDYCDILNDNDKVWVYLNSDFNEKEFLSNNIPNKDFPIVQSYVDICINGCLELVKEYPFLESENFTRNFINDTLFWNEFWVNDRIYPRRPFIHCPNAYTIDRLLIENLKESSLIKKIYFE
jgi:hypothetical protein